jgi:pseudaminic acid synthase
MSIKIGDLSVGPGFPPLIVAELSGNHNGSLARALEIVDAIARSGAQAVKLQTYTADSMTIDKADSEFVVSDPASLWHGRTLYSLYREAATPWEWHAQIMGRARELRMACFSTPFDESAVDFLETLDVPAYKIASFENVHLPLIRKAAATGKPLIISTGMASIAEIDDAVRAAREGGCRQLVLLKCTSTYPASPLNSNVVTIPHMRALFDCEIGLSDHTMGIGAAVAAVAHGASVIEKHVTMNRAAGGVDSAFSLEPEELRALVLETERAWQSLGRVTYGPSEAEKKSLVFRRSIYVAQDLRAGDALTRDNIRCVRPGLGLAPKYYELLLGRRIKQNVEKGTPLSWELVE